jgi:hypothetical protein
MVENDKQDALIIAPGKALMGEAEISWKCRSFDCTGHKERGQLRSG